jgi:hypothetical protein
LGLWRFTLLYFICLGGSVGVVHGVGLDPESETSESTQEISEYIEVPPKPDGVDLEQAGEGESDLYNWADCLARNGDFRDACFRALAWQWAAEDPDGALESCAMVQVSEQRWECESDVAELHAPVDRERAERICPSIPPRKWRDQCWFGIALSHSHIDFDYARDTCNQAGRWRDFCRHDVNGEISQVDPEEALRWCELEEGTLLQRKTCFHGLGKYIGRENPSLAVEYCQRVPTHEPLYPENCFHGLGWAVAESSPVGESIGFCDMLDGYSDSCLLGVSANAKRVDSGLAYEVCGGVVNDNLRGRCEAFAQRERVEW